MKSFFLLTFLFCGSVCKLWLPGGLWDKVERGRDLLACMRENETQEMCVILLLVFLIYRPSRSWQISI